MRTLFTSVFSALLLSGCVSSTTELNTTYYDYQLYSPQGKQLSVDNLPANILDADVVLVGEWHTHAGVHRFQADLLQALSRTPKAITLSMEQFARPAQKVLNDYLNSRIGEQPLMSEGDAWPNYESDYRPLVEFAKANDMDVLAANAPKPMVRCIGREGLTYLDKLSAERRQQVASEINTGPSAYKDKFMASMHHGKPEQTERQYAAQVTWDETMAESIVNYLKDNPETQILHIAGKFHIEDGLGTKASILRRNPTLKVVVITPVTKSTQAKADYQLAVLEPPVRFVQRDNRLKAIHALTQRNDDLICE